MTQEEFDKNSMFFEYCNIVSRTLIDDIAGLTLGNRFEALIFTTALVSFYMDRISRIRTEERGNFLIYKLHQDAMRANFDKNVAGNFVRFIERRTLLYLDEFIRLISNDDKVEFPSFLANNLFYEPFQEDKTCSDSVIVALLRTRVKRLDALVAKSSHILIDYF